MKSKWVRLTLWSGNPFFATLFLIEGQLLYRPSPSPPYPFRLLKSPCLNSLSHTANSHGRKSFPLICFYKCSQASVLTHFSTLAWKIPWTEDPDVHGVVKSQTQLSNFTFTFHFHGLEKEMATYSSVLAWKIPGTGEPGGLLSVGWHRVRQNWSDLAAAAAVRYLV